MSDSKGAVVEQRSYPWGWVVFALSMVILPPFTFFFFKTFDVDVLTRLYLVGYLTDFTERYKISPNAVGVVATVFVAHVLAFIFVLMSVKTGIDEESKQQEKKKE